MRQRLWQRLRSPHLVCLPFRRCSSDTDPYAGMWAPWNRAVGTNHFYQVYRGLRGDHEVDKTPSFRIDRGLCVLGFYDLCSHRCRPSSFTAVIYMDHHGFRVFLRTLRYNILHEIMKRCRQSTTSRRQTEENQNIERTLINI